jgi:hypothetical protein
LVEAQVAGVILPGKLTDLPFSVSLTQAVHLQHVPVIHRRLVVKLWQPWRQPWRLRAAFRVYIGRTLWPLVLAKW